MVENVGNNNNNNNRNMLKQSLFLLMMPVIALLVKFGTSALPPRIGGETAPATLTTNSSSSSSNSHSNNVNSIIINSNNKEQVPIVELSESVNVLLKGVEVEKDGSKKLAQNDVKLSGSSEIAVVRINGANAAGSSAGIALPGKSHKLTGAVCTPSSDINGCDEMLMGCRGEDIVVMMQGECTFATKAALAAAAGAKALLLVATDTPKLMAGLDDALLPVIMIANDKKDSILNQQQQVNIEIWQYEISPYDLTEFVMSIIALCVVAFGAWVSTSDLRHNSMIEQPQKEELVEMSTGLVFAFFGCGSCMLMVLYFFMNAAIYFLIFFFCAGGFSAMTILLRPAVSKLSPNMNSVCFSVPSFGPIVWADITTATFATAVQIGWILYRNNPNVGWVFQDITGVFLLLSIQRVLKLPNFQLGFVFLSLFLLFDIFWVFISPLLFESSVMVAVASGGDTGESVPMLLRLPVYGDDLGGSRMLGFGDMALPGLFISYVLRYEMMRSTSPPKTFSAALRQPLFLSSLFGYIVGMTITFFALYIMRKGQPALLYLVPCTFISLLSCAKYVGQLSELWHSSTDVGIHYGDDNDHHDDEHANRELSAPQDSSTQPLKPVAAHDETTRE